MVLASTRRLICYLLTVLGIVYVICRSQAQTTIAVRTAITDLTSAGPNPKPQNVNPAGEHGLTQGTARPLFGWSLHRPLFFFFFPLFEMLGMTWADSGALPGAHIVHVLKAREHFLPMYRI